MTFAVGCFAAALLVATASAASAKPIAPGGGAAATGSAPVTVTLTLSGTESQTAESYAAAVSTPGTSMFRHRLSRSQVRTQFGASTAQVTRVSTWLRRAGFTVTGLDSTGSRLTATGTARAVRAAFGVAATPQIRHGVRVEVAATPRLPASVAPDVRAVSGLSGLVTQPMHVAPRTINPAADGQFCASYWGEWNNTEVPQKYPAGKQSNPICGYNGAQLRALYGLSSTDTGRGQTIVIVGAYNNTNALADANATFATNGVAPLPASRYVMRSYGSGGTASGCDVPSWTAEQALDIQAVHTIAPDATIVYAQAPDCTQLLNTLAAVVGDASLHASIISASWGTQSEPTDPAELAATNSILARAAIMGIGVYVASGDFGDDSNVPGSTGTSVSFPASSPWATAVGGTSSALGANNQVLWQTGWEDAGESLSAGAWKPLTPPFVNGAGGGSSTVFTKPTWQTGTGAKRLVPDVAALADPYTGFFVGYTSGGSYAAGPLGGTSLATPIMAGLAAVAQGRAGADSDIGFAAPVLYAKAAAGHPLTVDVQHVAAGVWTPGINADTPLGDYLIDLDAGVQSLKTAAGYDPVTGLGVPGPAFLSGITS